MKSRLPAIASLALTVAASAAGMPFIEVDPGKATALREHGTGRPFVAVGVNYFDHETGWAPKLWQKFDEARVAKHLDLLQKQGFNTIRIFLTLQSFHQEPGQVHPEGERKFRRLIELCRERGIRVIPSGPDHWEGTPSWRGRDQFAVAGPVQRCARRRDAEGPGPQRARRQGAHRVAVGLGGRLVGGAALALCSTEPVARTRRPTPRASDSERCRCVATVGPAD